MVELNADGTIVKTPKVNASDKNERYNWNKDLGPKGYFKWIDKHEIHIDNKYQRGTSEPKALKIARNFTWLSFGCLVVVKRDNGGYYATDGFHRVTGAMKREDIKKIPCIVYDENRIEREAGAFIAINKYRKAITGVELWKAQFAAKDKDTTGAYDIISGFGYRVGSTPDNVTICAAQAVWSLHRSGLLKDVLTFVTRMWGDDRHKLHSDVLKASEKMAISIRKYKKTILDDDVTSRFSKTNLSDLIRKSKQVLAATNSSGRIQALYLVMAGVYNKGRIINKIQVSDLICV